MTTKIKIPLIVCLVTAILFIIDLVTASLWTPLIGWLIEKFFPCQQLQFPMDTPPCSVGYDFVIIPIILGIFILSLATLIGRIIYSKLKKE